MKTKTKATVVLHKQLLNGIYDLRLATGLAADAHAGQFIGIYTKDRSKLLPRPISICEVDGNRLRLVYRVTGPGTGTDEISRLKPGDEVEILGILGNGYDVSMIASAYKHPVLMGGGIGIPPMLELARELSGVYEDAKRTGARKSDDSVQNPESVAVNSGISNVSAILGYRDGNLFLADDFVDVADVYIATEDGSVGTKGNVLDVMKGSARRWYGKNPMETARTDMSYPQVSPECDVILACGPMPMLRAIAAYAKENGIKAYISLEERMACGIGACLGCIAKTKEPDPHTHVKNARICTDGPVFDADLLDI